MRLRMEMIRTLEWTPALRWLAAVTVLAVVAAACTEKRPFTRPCGAPPHADITPQEVDVLIGTDTVPFIHVNQCDQEVGDDDLYWTTTDTLVIAITPDQTILAIGYGTGVATLNGQNLGPGLGTFTVHVGGGGTAPREPMP